MKINELSACNFMGVQVMISQKNWITLSKMAIQKELRK